MIRHTVAAGHAAGKRVAMCGEMAGDPLFTLVLLGLEVDDLSMNAAALPLVKRMIRQANAAEAKKLAEHVLTLSSAEEIEVVVRAESQRFLLDMQDLSTSSQG
jgi:phosphotransferase system enzyme I (PtsI)